MRSSIEAVTPAGTLTGFLPMRLISEALREHFAADILLARFRVGQNAARRRDDRNSQAVADARQILSPGINPAAGLGDPGDVLDRGLALEIFQLDSKAGMLA